MSTWQWALVAIGALLFGPIALALFMEFMYWWLDNTVGRFLDWLEK